MATRAPLAHRLAAVLAIAGLAACAGAGAADTDKKAAARDREQARRIQKLQQENGELKAKLKELGDKGEEAAQGLERAKREAAGTARELARVKREGDEAAAARMAEFGAKADALEAEKKELRRQLDETSQRLAQRDREKRQLEGVAAVQLESLGRQGGLLTSCRGDNAALYRYGTELLEIYKAEGRRGSGLLIGLGEVESFNTYQEYREKLDKLKAEPPRLAN